MPLFYCQPFGCVVDQSFRNSSGSRLIVVPQHFGFFFLCDNKMFILQIRGILKNRNGGLLLFLFGVRFLSFQTEIFSPSKKGNRLERSDSL
jgi:hypothetical protein